METRDPAISHKVSKQQQQQQQQQQYNVLFIEFSLRLVDTETDNFYKGHVQIYHLGKWGYVCDSGWDSLDGVTACIQLGFQGFQQITRQSYHGNVTGMSWTDNVACKEGDRSFAECGILFNDSANCTSFAGVQCVTLGEFRQMDSSISSHLMKDPYLLE